VQVVAVEVVADAVAVVQLVAHVGGPVVVRVAQVPEAREAGEEHVLPAHEHAGRDAVLEAVEAVGEHRVVVGPAVAVAVLDPAESLGRAGHVGHLGGREILLDHRLACRDGAAGGVVVEPVHHAADVDHVLLAPERLDHVEPVLLVDVKGDRVGHPRLGREQLDLKPRRHLELPERLLALVRSRGDERHVRRLLRLLLGEGRRAGAEQHNQHREERRNDARY
jgi:hypothetical protein